MTHWDVLIKRLNFVSYRPFMFLSESSSFPALGGKPSQSPSFFLIILRQ